MSGYLFPETGCVRGQPLKEDLGDLRAVGEVEYLDRVAFWPCNHGCPFYRLDKASAEFEGLE